MRQAGRYMPEYRALRAKHTLLTLCRTPELAVEVTLQPVRALDVDAAILFSDLLLPLAPLGVPFDFQAGEGPRRSRARCARRRTSTPLRRFDPREELGMVLEAIRLVRRELDGRVPLIGFAGAPFTLASYAIEGGHSVQLRRHEGADVRRARTAWHRLAALLADVVADYLLAQVEAGAQALQVFDSWVGALDEARLPRVRVAARARASSSGCAAAGVPADPLRHGHRPPARGCSARPAAT